MASGLFQRMPPAALSQLAGLVDADRHQGDQDQGCHGRCGQDDLAGHGQTRKSAQAYPGMTVLGRFD